MTTLLHIRSGLFGENSQSNQLSAEFVDAFRAARPETHVVERDLAARALPHLDGATVAAFMTPDAQRNDAEREAVRPSEEAIAQLREADVLVIGLPMYNFSLPSTLKAWIDHVVRAGETFRYVDGRPEGLLTGKKAVIVAARGGVYRETGNDFQTPYIQQVLNFIGITDVTFIHAEGLRMADEVKAEAIAAARDGMRLAVAA